MKNALGSLLVTSVVAGLAGLVSLTGGCVVRARVPAPVAVIEVEEEPPPARHVVVETRPGYIYIEGRWIRRGGRWEWHEGHWERQRTGYVWVPGRWERRGRRHVWIEGEWRAGGTVIRDHR